MPIFNESEGIVAFLTELNETFSHFDTEFLVVDDCSGDNSAELVQEFAKDFPNIRLLAQKTNRGHGPSTLIGLREAIRSSPDVVVTADGDGQISGDDLLRIAQTVTKESSGYVEGVRTSRNEPWFRGLVSMATRTLVFLRSGKTTRDANTPFRGYQIQFLSEVLERLPANSATPNLIISAYARKAGWHVSEVKIVSLHRRGESSVGTTWKQGNPSIPSSRFIWFCVRASLQWMTTRLSGSR